MASGRELDGLARDLASGRISRRSALARLAGAALGVTIASVPGAGALASAADSKRCPKSRRCGEKCCPKHAKCKRGKCKCESGYSKCGKKCVDLQSDTTHCGDCDTACTESEVCSAGDCVTPTACGNGTIDPGETCDGNDLGGQTCQTLGFASGTLACNPNCMAFDTSQCSCGPGQDLCEGQCTDLSTVENCGGCGNVCSDTHTTNATCAGGLACSYACANGYVNCNQTAPNLGGCECVGTACCPGNTCQTEHDNGVGQHFYDCTPRDTYNQSQAIEACAASTGSATGCAHFTCSGAANDELICSNNGNASCKCWSYSGTFVGHVDTACGCPNGSDPVWH